MPVKTRFSARKEIDRSQIMVNPSVFQGRPEKFAKATTNKIINEGFDKSYDPIVVWKDLKRNKYIVISGHSRWEASKILYNKGDKTLKKMPVKIFNGGKDDAIKYAVVESNRNAKEPLISDIKAYKIAIKHGYNKKELLSFFNPESKLRMLQDLSFLDIEGSFLTELSKSSSKSFPFLKRNAQWVGTLRKMYRQLTNRHEKELFNYFYQKKEGKSGINIKKDKFFEQVTRKVQSLDFNSNKPLNIHNLPSTSSLTKYIDEDLKKIDSEIRKLETQRKSKENYLIKSKIKKDTKLIKKFSDDIAVIQRNIIAKLTEKEYLLEGRKKLKKTTTSLFSQRPVKKATPRKAKTTKKTAINSRSKVIPSPPLRSKKRGVKRPVSPKINKMKNLKAPKTRIGKILTLPKAKQNIIVKLPTRTQNAILKEPKAKQNRILASVKTAKAYTISGNKKRVKSKLPYALSMLNKEATKIQRAGGRKPDKKVQGAFKISRTTAMKKAAAKRKKVLGTSYSKRAKLRTSRTR